MTLEPMSPYERRIIHSEVQGIRGVTTNSIGVDNNRRVVISWEGDGRRDRDRGGRRRHGPRREERHTEVDPESGEAFAEDDEVLDTVDEEYTDVEDLMKELEEDKAE